MFSVMDRGSWGMWRNIKYNPSSLRKLQSRGRRGNKSGKHINHNVRASNNIHKPTRVMDSENFRSSEVGELPCGLSWSGKTFLTSEPCKYGEDGEERKVRGTPGRHLR